MKKILITGANSYIGTSFESYLQQWKDDYQIDTIDMIGDSWKSVSFSNYDVVFHVAGIAHADTGHVSKESQDFYYKINTDLTIETAIKAKKEGVKQFIFMSSIIVYGECASIGKVKIIDKNTIPSPKNFYGDSKLKAEKGILLLQDEKFNVVILRPPMIYGKGSKGNYPILSKLTKKLLFFPYIKNKRSMLYIENLCEFIKLMIVNNERGIFFPQNGEYSTTSELVKIIGNVHGKKIILVKGFGWLLKIIGFFTGLINKAFGSIIYDMSLSGYKENYIIYDLKESIYKTEME